MSSRTCARGVELVWVNASPTGPTESDGANSRDHIVFRLQVGKTKTISRSSPETSSAPINDLDDSLEFFGAKVVSRQHAAIEWKDDEPILKDLGSTHGTFVADRAALFLEDDSILETAPDATKKRVEGIHVLRFGEMIEFGKECSRSDKMYYPVRCYLRPAAALALPPNSHPNSTTTTKSGTYCFTDVVDLASEDETQSDDDPTDDLAQSLTFGAQVEPFEKSSTILDNRDGSDSESGSDESVDSCNIYGIRWHHTIDEAASERVELDREAAEARSQGDSYMSSYKSVLEPDSPATSVGATSATIDEADGRAPPAALSKLLVDAVEGSPLTASDVDEPSPKHKTDTVDAAGRGDGDGDGDGDGVDERRPATDLSLALHASVSTNEMPEKAIDFTPPTPASLPASSLPLPNKKRRLTYLRRKGYKLRMNRPSSRQRLVKTILARTFYATSLLSVGFLTGSLFTFKSLMNAAAASNAASSGK